MAKKKIPTHSGGPFTTSLESVFSGIPLSELPEGPLLPEEAPKEKPKGSLVLHKEKAHRNGKTVIVIDQFTPQPSEKELRDLTRLLQTQCGCGGSQKEGAIELQGDQPARVREILESLGYRVRGI